MHHPFTPVASVPVDPRKARVHEEGWQSWSPSGAYALGATPPPTSRLRSSRGRPHRPTNANWATVCYRPGVTVPAGTFQGEGLLALDPGDGSPVRLWAAAEPTREVPSIRLVGGDGRVAEISADGPVKEWTGPDIQSVLGEWATGLGLDAPRPAPTVWCSWYEYFTGVTEDDIHENLRAMDTLDLPVDVVQIDDGYQRALGDWLTLSGRFRSRAGIAEKIRSRGRRAGIGLIRDAIGEDAYLLGCGAPLLASIGLFDAMRVSPDTAPHRRPEADDYSQPGQDPAEFTGAARQWQHQRLWINDPDCLMARPAVETREQWAAHVESTGGLMASSDRLLSLDPWGVETTRRLLSGTRR
ncbi:alpha-galactosidase [Streptomyces massasporeus]